MQGNRSNKKILVVGDNITTFIFKSIISALKREGFEDVIEKTPKLSDLAGFDEDVDAIVLYCGEAMSSYEDGLKILKEYCLSKQKKMALIGYDMDVSKVKEIVTPRFIWHVFPRPLNLDVFIEKLDEEIFREKTVIIRKHILVVDDSGIVLRMVNDWLSDKYYVTMASSASMAFTCINTSDVDLILLDYDMPVCSGAQFLEMLRQEPKTADIPVIFLTSMSDRKSVKSVMDLHPNGYLLKTLPKNQIIRAIDGFFEKKIISGE